ncbi:MAG TPA: DUF4190 domain-containing protein [Pirellulales bacterium]|jgi:hypothetical protein|nr:DUF4190 domain-containing protein [Pirellulales bacterium]
MSVDLERFEQAGDDPFLQYRALSRAAVASLVAGVASFTALLAWPCLGIPVVGILLGSYAWRSIRNRPDELAGLPVAKAGVALSALFAIVGPAWLLYQHATEVPDGYERISYEELQPTAGSPPDALPVSAFALEGKKIFIKGYVYPGRELEGIKTFLLVRDQGDCCFGGNPKITDRIQVTLSDPLRLAYKSRLHKLAGVFHVRPTTAINAGGGVYYQLDADYLR